jgi:hypothetical protein
MPKHLIFTVGFENLYFMLADMMCHTIRDTGKYQGDLIIFTTQNVTSPWAETINVAEHPDAELLRTGRREYFHSKLLPRVDSSLKPYGLPYDYFMIKALPGTFVKRDQYDVIYYFDSDMLITGPLEEIFATCTGGTEHIMSGFHGHSAARQMRHARKLLTPEQLEYARKVSAVGGGVVGVPRAHYRFYDHFGRNYLKLLRETRHDMPALSLTMIEGAYPHANLPRRKFWRHFWGSERKKKRMIASYQKMYGACSPVPVTPAFMDQGDRSAFIVDSHTNDLDFDIG